MVLIAFPGSLMAEFVIHSLAANSKRYFKYFPDIRRKKTQDYKTLPDNKGSNSGKH